MESRDYLFAIALLEGAIRCLDEENLNDVSPEAIEYVMGKLLKVKREVEKDAWCKINQEMTEKGKKVTFDDIFGVREERKVS